MTARILLLLAVAYLTAACSTPVETLRATAYGEIARAQMAAGDAAGARQTADLAVAAIDSTKPDDDDERLFGLPAAAVARVRAGDLAGAERTVELAEGDSLVLGYTVLALGLRNAGYDAEAVRIAAKALEAASGPASEKKIGERMVFAGWAQAIAGDTAAAIAIADSIGDDKNRGGLLALITAEQVARGNIGDARTTFGLIPETIPASDNDAWLFGIFAQGVAVDGLSVLDTVLFESRVPLRAILMTRIAVAQARSGDHAGGKQSFLAAMQLAETAENMAERARAVANIGLARAHAGDLIGAIESLNYAENLASLIAGDDSAGIEVTTHIRVLRAVVEGNRPAADLIVQMEGLDKRTETLVLAALAHLRLGRAAQAAEFLAAAAKTVEREDDQSLVAAGYGKLADVHARRGEAAAAMASAQKALQIAQAIPPSSEDRLIGHFFAAVALARAGDTARALETAAALQGPQQ